MFLHLEAVRPGVALGGDSLVVHEVVIISSAAFSKLATSSERLHFIVAVGRGLQITDVHDGFFLAVTRRLPALPRFLDDQLIL